MRRFLAGLLFMAVATGPAAAHPHVWVAVKAMILYTDSHISGIQYEWTFDELYTAMAIQGLDTNNDGAYSREELAELAKINMEGLEEFGYFTDARLGSARLAFAKPTDYWLDYTNSILTLHFTLPFNSPVPASAEGFSAAVYDPSYFISFDLAKSSPVTLGDGAPPGCKPEVTVPKENAEEAQRLGEAFFAQLGGTNFGLSLAKTISVQCPRS